MYFRSSAFGLCFIFVSLSIAQASPWPSAQCVLNTDKSRLSLVVSNLTDEAYACTASCRYKLTGQRPLYTLDCNYALRANTDENVACDVDGTGPQSFGELLPVKFTCQPR